MRAGIGITWLDAKGGAVGSIYPQHRTTAPAATALELWVERDDGLARYQNWLRARRMEVLVRWGQQHAATITPQLWERTKREWVYGRQFTTHLQPGLLSLCLAYVASQLANYGLAPQLWGARVEGIHLDLDLCELMWAEMNLGAGALADKADAEVTLTTLFERWSTANACAIRLHLSSLHRTALKSLHT